MRWGTILVAAGFVMPTGCQLARNVVHNLANESAEQWDERKLSRQLRAEARAAWATYCQQSGGAFSADFADGFIALPGGYGTFEEMFEMLTWGQLGYHAKPCGFLNVAGYYDALFTFLDACVDARFVTRVHRDMIIAAEDPNALLDGMAAFQPPDQAKWLDRFDL